MADSIDRRSEGKTTTPKALARRAKVKAWEAAGLCKYCGKKPVQGRLTCVACCDKQTLYTALWGAKRVFQEAGIDWNSDAQPTASQWATLTGILR